MAAVPGLWRDGAGSRDAPPIVGDAPPSPSLYDGRPAAAGAAGPLPPSPSAAAVGSNGAVAGGGWMVSLVCGGESCLVEVTSCLVEVTVGRGDNGGESCLVEVT
eukprot:gene4583-58071_t